MTQSALMETNQLQDRLHDSTLKILDATYYISPSSISTATGDARADYAASRIPGALFFDIDAIADPHAHLPHMLPGADDFEQHMHRMGIGSDHTIVVYDAQGLFSAARVWWMFRYFGHNQVFVLNGGFPKWLAEQRPVETHPPIALPQSGLPQSKAASLLNPRFKAQVQPELLASMETLKAFSLNATGTQPVETDLQVLDMRSASRFKGEAPEPRPGLRSGHIPGSLNMPWSQWLNADQTLLSKTRLQALCQQKGVNWEAQIVNTCGSGLTACIGALALYELGNEQAAVYDGSWAEWGADASLPIATTGMATTTSETGAQQ